MHEYPVTCEIISIAENYARQNQAASVSEIALVVGENAGISADCLELYFDLIARETLCENAKLKIKAIRAKLQCEKCGGLFHRKPFTFQCPACGGSGRPTEIGREFYVEAIRVSAEF
jgi:hydrogenase nickel incorporation protein HypA/HybF